MIRARIHNGQVEVQGSIPDSWEGQTVKIVPLTPDDEIPDLEVRLAALHALGPMEFDEDERAQISADLKALDELSKEAMRQIHPS
ncbi:MAG: hypothetical protein HYS13_09880 [Planctomycetia bacterium]|nr:hypothetical protein [Planctomycetia bacterium]